MRRLLFAFLVATAFTSTAYASDEDELVMAGRSIDANPASPEAYEAFAQLAFKMKRWDDAIARLKQGTQGIAAYHMGWYKLAYAYRQKKDFAAAAAAYRKFGELEPSRADTYFGLGAALQGAGDKKGALAAYKRYVELEKSADKQRFVEQVRGEIEKLEDGPAVVTPPVAKVTPPPIVAPPTATPPTSQTNTPPAANALALRAQADKLRQNGKLDEAAAAYERALSADPGNLDLHIELGDVYFAQKRYNDAAKIFRTAVEHDGGYALGWYNLAHAESRAGEQGASVRAYKEYIKLRPSDPDPFYGLGQTYKAMGDSKNAVESFRTYLKMERRPESQRWVDKARRELEQLEGRGARRDQDLKNPFRERDGAYASNDELLPPGGEEARREHERIAREIAADDILPIEEDEARARTVRDLKDPFADLPERSTGNANRDRLAKYASALAAYRAALDRQASDAAALYQRGAERVLANDLRGAQRAWAQTVAPSSEVEQARARLEKARTALLAK